MKPKFQGTSTSQRGLLIEPLKLTIKLSFSSRGCFDRRLTQLRHKLKRVNCEQLPCQNEGNFNACCQPTCLLQNLLLFEYAWSTIEAKVTSVHLTVLAFGIPSERIHSSSPSETISKVPLVTTSNRKRLPRLQGCGCVGKQWGKT